MAKAPVQKKRASARAARGGSKSTKPRAAKPRAAKLRAAKPRSAKPRSAAFSASHSEARRDQRYKDQSVAPPIVSEKRITFFLPAALYSEMRRLTGLAQAANAGVGVSRFDDHALPESPSALLREAVEHYLDQARPKASRPAREWAARIKQIRTLIAGRRR